MSRSIIGQPICPGTYVCWARYVCDRRHPSVGKPRPVGLAFGPGSTREGHKERALPDRREPPGIDSSARPRLRRIGHHWSEGACSPATANRAQPLYTGGLTTAVLTSWVPT